MKKINWGVIGLGNIAQKFLESFSEVKNANLVAIASNDKFKLEENKSKFNINNDFVFNDYEKLIMCNKVDIVYISLPNSFHFYWIKKCIENKKKFLVEKPATLNFQEAINLKSIIENNNLFFAEGFMYRYDPLIIKLIELIKSNEIGDLLSLESSFGVNILTKKNFLFFKKKKKINKNSRQFNKQLGGGCILDLGCYPTSLTILMASLMKNLDYTNFEIKVLNREIGETDVDINSEAEIIFQNGFKSNVKASFKHNLGNNTLVKGKNGEINIKNTFLGIKEIEVNLKNKTYKINKRINKNIYAIEIENISQNILEQKSTVMYPGMRIEETFINMKILESWRNDE
jgi:predicted dehydrogenase